MPSRMAFTGAAPMAATKLSTSMSDRAFTSMSPWAFTVAAPIRASLSFSMMPTSKAPDMFTVRRSVIPPLPVPVEPAAPTLVETKGFATSLRAFLSNEPRANSKLMVKPWILLRFAARTFTSWSAEPDVAMVLTSALSSMWADVSASSTVKVLVVTSEMKVAAAKSIFAVAVNGWMCSVEVAWTITPSARASSKPNASRSSAVTRLSPSSWLRLIWTLSKSRRSTSSFWIRVARFVFRSVCAAEVRSP